MQRRQAEEDMKQLMQRYSNSQLIDIADYFDLIAHFTRKSGKISVGVKVKEMEYWIRFPVDIVIRSLKIHMKKYQTRPEKYTRGIIRNLAREGERSHATTERTTERGNYGRSDDQDRYVDPNHLPI